MKFPGKWEFPGGKVEPGEAAQAALQRELSEELALPSRVLDHFHDAPFGEHTIAAYWVEPLGEPRPLEHEGLAWSTAADLLTYELLPADVEIAERLVALRGNEWPTGG